MCGALQQCRSHAQGPKPRPPGLVISDLGLFDFVRPVARCGSRAYIGVTVEQVQKKTGFALIVPAGDVPDTPAPTAKSFTSSAT